MTLATARRFQAEHSHAPHVSVALPAMRPTLQVLSGISLDPVLQALPAAVILLDQRGIVYQANPAAVAMLGEPLLAQAWFTIISRCFQPRDDDGLEVSLKDGRRVKLQISPILTQSAYTVPGQLIMLTDLTETRQLQSRLSHMQRLSTLGKMMATLAHQIRTPLSAAMLYAQNLASPRLNVQTQQQFQQKLMSRLQDLAQQVNDMLAFARSGSAQQVKAFSLAQLQQQLLTDTEALLQQHDARLQIHCSNDQLTLLGNISALSGALQNLMHNATQAVPTGAVLTLTLEQASPSALAIRLCDNGPGVPEALLPNLFEPFVTGRAQGTGLGLAVVQAVAHSHHGSVRYIKQPEGACFEIRLPLATKTQETLS